MVILVVFFSNLEICLGMLAYGANLGCSSTDNHVSAVTALPNGNTALLEYCLLFYVVQKCAVSLLVSLLDSSNSAELCSELGKALFLSVLSKAVVHIGPLVVLTLSGVKKVLSGIAKLTESLEPELCVLLLVLSGLKEDCGDLLITCFLCYRCKVGVLVSCLRFTCEGFPKVLLGL